MLILTTLGLALPAMAKGDKSQMKKADAEQTGSMTTGNQAAGADTSSSNPEVITEAHVAKIMTVVNEGEIDAAKVADGKAKNERVKAFAEKMKKEHKHNKKEAKKVAKKADIDMEKHAMVEMLKENNKATVEKLKEASEAEFDRVYMQSQVDMHQTILNHINTKFMPAAQNPAFKSYLQKTKASIQGHLREAQSIQKTL